MTTWVFCKNSKISWKTVTIMAWVHGNEQSWIKVLEDMVDSLEITSWKVYFRV